MEKRLQEAKKLYEGVEIPMELNNRVDEALASKKKNNKVWVKYGASAAIVGLCCVAGLNTNAAFAQAMGEIPIVGQVAKIFTFAEFKESSPAYIVDARIPGVTSEEDVKFSQEVNEMIQVKMNAVLEESKLRAEEYKEAYVETGGNPEEFMPVEIKMDYEVKHQGDDALSFIIYKGESFANAYSEQYTYNIDMNTKEEIGLEDLLGERYQEIANESIKQQIIERNKTAEVAYFEGDAGFQGIREDQPFYINEQGNPVIVFDKYEIAPGAAGVQEFELIL